MSTKSAKLLVATEWAGFFAAVGALAQAQDFLERNFQPEHCLPHQIESWLREYDAEALLVTRSRFEEHLPAAVRRWKAMRPHLQVLMLFQHELETRALVALMRAGAFDVVDAAAGAAPEYFVEESLESLSKRLEEVQRGSLERLRARESIGHAGLVGESPEMQNLYAELAQAARVSCPVLISGEPGSGKRLAAHAIHALSPRNGKPIVTVDCCSVSPSLLEVELCGPEPGGPPRGSLVRAAQQGTLLLNGVAELAPGLQFQLLRLLETGEQPGPAELDLRVISTASASLDQMVEDKVFRLDLYYRLNVLPIEVPPLRRRLGDVPLLARHFLNRHARDHRSFVLTEEAGEALMRHRWPGNVRELKAAMEYAVTHGRDNTIVPAHLPEGITTGSENVRRAEPEPSSIEDLNLARLEAVAVRRALNVTGFDKAKAARLLGIGKTTLYRKLKEIRKESSRQRQPVEDLYLM